MAHIAFPAKIPDQERTQEAGQHHTQSRTQHREKQALGKQLADDASFCRTECDVYRDFLFSGAGPSEQQVRQVRARDQQHQPRDRQQQPQRRLIPLPKIGHPCCFPDTLPTSSAGTAFGRPLIDGGKVSCMSPGEIASSWALALSNVHPGFNRPMTASHHPCGSV